MRSLYNVMYKTKKQKGRGPKQEPETKKETTKKSKLYETPEERIQNEEYFLKMICKMLDTYKIDKTISERYLDALKEEIPRNMTPDLLDYERSLTFKLEHKCETQKDRNALIIQCTNLILGELPSTEPSTSAHTGPSTEPPTIAHAGPSTEPPTSAHAEPPTHEGPSTEPSTSAPKKDLMYKKLGLELTRLGIRDNKVVDLLNNLEKLSAYYKFTHDEDEFIISDVYERIKEKKEVNEQGKVKVMKMNNEIKKILILMTKILKKLNKLK